MRGWIPNSMTLGNAACGFAGILALVQGGPDAAPLAALLIFGGWVFDIADGMVARRLGVSGPFGAALDSLCDVVTFGLLPGLLAALVVPEAGLPLWLGWIVGAGYLFAAILRLARFTVGADHAHATEGFRLFEGLSSPAAALSVSVALLFWAPLAVVMAVIVAPLMVSRLPYPDLAMPYLTGRLPIWHLAVPIALVVTMGPAAALVGISLLYIVLGPVLGHRLADGDTA